MGKAFDESDVEKEEQKEDPELEAGVSALAKAMLAQREQMKKMKNQKKPSTEVQIDENYDINFMA